MVINNAAYPLVGTIEEASEKDIRAQFETNFYGTLRVIKAVLPILRKQGHGHIIGVSSTLGIVAMPIIGYYSVSKWAIESVARKPGDGGLRSRDSGDHHRARSLRYGVRGRGIDALTGAWMSTSPCGSVSWKELSTMERG